MRDELADVVYPTVSYALQVRAGLERGDDLNMIAVQSELRTLLKTANEAMRWPEYGGDGDRYLGIRYALTCWLDELFILDSPWGPQWNERKLEESLYGSNERAWKFWFQAKLAQARPGTDALEAFYLCVMLGFRGEGPEKPDTVVTWRDAVENQLSRVHNQPWPGPQELQPELNAMPRRAKERLRTLLIGVIGMVALLIPAATFYLVYKFHYAQPAGAIVSRLIDLFRSLIGFVLPFLGKAKGAAGLGRGLRWFLHALVLILILVGLHFLNDFFKIHELLPGQHYYLRTNWLPLLFLLSYVLCWLGYWLWTLLIIEDEHPEFPDINEAWDEAVKALDRAGIDLRNMPVYMVLGRPETSAEVLLQAARLNLEVKQAPARGDAPLHVFASKDAVFITCEGACLLGKEAQFLASGGSPNLSLGGSDDEEILKTLSPVNAGGAVPEFLAIRQRAERERRELTPDEQHRIRALIRQDQIQFAPIRNPDEVARQTARFEHFCRLLIRDRWPYVPITGVLLLVPFAATDSDQDALDTGATVQHDLEVIHRVLQVQSPTLALVCDLETAPGFSAFLERFPDKQRHQRVGHRSPFIPDLDKFTSDGDPAKARAAMFEGLAQWICGSVVASWVSKHYRLETPGRDSVSSATADNAHLFLFMNELRQRGRRLGRLLARGLTLESQELAWFGGCYLAGTGVNPEGQQGFVAGVFRRLIEEEKKGLVSWTGQALEEEAGLQRWVGALQIALGVVVVAAVALIGYAFWKK